MKKKAPSKNTNLYTSFLDAKLNFDSIEQALSRARALQFSEKDCCSLITEKMKRMKEYQTLRDNVINSFTQNNVIKMDDNWFGILCKKNELLVQPLYEDNIKSIKIDFTTNAAKPRETYDQFLETNVNKNVLTKYINMVRRNADELLNIFFDCKNTIIKNGETYRITSHCLKRWEERINNSRKNITIKNRNSIMNNLSKSFQQSVYVYSNITDNFVVKFFLNFNDMIFFAVTGDNIILSIWRNSFGFTDDDINKKATLMQLEHIKKVSQDYYNLSVKHSNFVKCKKSSLETLNVQINHLNEQISKLNQSKELLENKCEDIKLEINTSRKQLKEALKNLKNEETLIFKSHKMLNED